MRAKFASALVAISLCTPVPAAAQMFQMRLTEACYDPSLGENPKAMAKSARYAEKAFAQYVTLARGAQNLNKIFSEVGYYGKAAKHRTWMLDGLETDPNSARDPWIANASAIRPLGLVLSHTGLGVRGQWQAVANDGRVLGTYDAFLVTHLGGYRMRWLRLYSAGKSPQADPLAPFCSYPGDIEEHRKDPKARLF